MKEIESRAYFRNSRYDILPLIPNECFEILDCGCGAGILGRTIKQRQPCYITGIDLNAEAAKAARCSLDKVMTGDIETLIYSDELAAGNWDCIILADILEHLSDPWALLKKCYWLLEPGGVIVISIPNVSHFSVLGPLLFKDKFHYDDYGILDRTHLRFFTITEIRNALFNAGFKIDLVKHNEYDRQMLSKKTRLMFSILRTLSLKRSLNYLAVQWLIRAIKC
jgi:2-polyprenyl-3-methyl-5-hydroxy-6-metoxy-1,4-benzoquinol methylase